MGRFSPLFTRFSTLNIEEHLEPRGYGCSNASSRVSLCLSEQLSVVAYTCTKISKGNTTAPLKVDEDIGRDDSTSACATALEVIASVFGVVEETGAYSVSASSGR